MKKGRFGAVRTLRPLRALRAAMLAGACAAAAAALSGCWIPAGGRMNASSLPDPAAAREPLPPPAVFGGRTADPRPAQALRRPTAPPGGAAAASSASPAAAGASNAVSKALDEAQARRAKPGLPTAAEVAERSGAPARSIEAVRPQAAPRIRTDLGVKPAPLPKPAPSVGAKFRQLGPIPGALGNPAAPPPAGGFVLPAPGGRR